ncbi:MAG TPA: hypothetical protein VJ925_10410 [Longimicrobiales bacterium]|nr:hypothetical protein [Longimicrobiales bacterium]
MKRSTRWVVAVLLLIFTAACESGPAGPGTLAVEVTAPIQLGAVQVRVVGTGITAVHGLGGSEVASRLVTTTDGEDSYRIVAFAPDGGPIRIGVDVESTDATLEAVALDAAGLDGVRVGVAGVEVQVTR